jgi:hypothetical protein
VSLIEGKVDCVIGACVFADIVDVSCAWKVIFELVEGASHDSVCEVESFLHAVAMMDIDIYVEHALISF